MQWVGHGELSSTPCCCHWFVWYKPSSSFEVLVSKPPLCLCSPEGNFGAMGHRAFQKPHFPPFSKHSQHKHSSQRHPGGGKMRFFSSLAVGLASRVEVSHWGLVQLRHRVFSQGFPTRPGWLSDISFLVKVSPWGLIEVSLKGQVKVSPWTLGRLSNISFFVEVSPRGLVGVSNISILVKVSPWGLMETYSMRSAQGFSTRPRPAFKHLIFSRGFSTRPGWALRHLVFGGIWEQKLQLKFVTYQPSSVWAKVLTQMWWSEIANVTVFCVVGEMCPRVWGQRN